MCINEYERLRALHSNNDIDSFRDELFKMTSDIGFKGISVAQENHHTGEFKVLTNFTPEYMEVYQKKEFHRYDHVLAHCRFNDTPINWQDPVHKKNLSQHARDVINTSADFNITTGIAIPVTGYLGRGLVSLHFDGSKEDLDKYCHESIFSLIGYCQTVISRISRDFPSELICKPKLTIKESDCLKYLSNGLSNPEIASVLCVSVDRIKEIVSSILKKLEAANRTEAVMHAFRLHII
ncbi:helix-turn-helix transcriptional regulator [Agarilytica rhodophyticola]|uniref:helix-turn-helix transcriptional regulator n=1 Tax=Agarilytica rhodophyticola TaxID=1737490 RepID=UPI00131A3D91|nr:autoinducer binding domain-containing protein [Agarilytica rhodophyticola]